MIPSRSAATAAAERPPHRPGQVDRLPYKERAVPQSPRPRAPRLVHDAFPEAREAGVAAPVDWAITVSATEPDWARERCTFGRWEPSRRLIRSIRRYQAWRQRWGVVGRAVAGFWVLRHRHWSRVCGCDIPLNCRLGGGLLLPHPVGVVFHPGVTIGPNCTIFQQVTIGKRDMSGDAPVIGGHVDVGAGAKVLGDIRVGDHASIGANAVVLCDVPDGATAVGIPARVIPPHR